MNKIYFTIIPPQSGVTDQLIAFSSFYKLGLSMSFHYVHTPFTTKRSSTFLNKSFNSDTDNNGSPGIYDFIGMNNYFIEKNKHIKLIFPRKIEIGISDEVLFEHNINDLIKLQRYIKQQIPGNLIFNRGILLTFKFDKKGIFPKYFYTLIHNTIINYPDNLNLKKVYEKYREGSPWQSIYPEGLVNTLVHIRQGDTACLETPWKSFLCLWPKDIIFNEYSDFNSIPSNRILKTEDFYTLIERLILYFEENIFSFLLFSDGFNRSFKLLEKKIYSLNYTDEMIESFLNTWKTYDEDKFRIFEQIDNSRLILGEDTEKLFHFFHSLFTADLIITGTQQSLVLKLIITCFSQENMPVIIRLGRGDIQTIYTKIIELSNKMDNFIYVDITNPDYMAISKKISSLLKIPGKKN